MIMRGRFNGYTKEDIEKWNTRELMTHFENIRAYRQNSLDRVEYAESQLKEAQLNLNLLDMYLVTLKDVLSTREHIPNKQEAKVIRQEKAKAKRNR